MTGTPLYPSPVDVHPVTQGSVIGSEWFKLTTLRSSWIAMLLGVALGFIVRSTAGGIAGLVGILLVLPGVVSILPQTWQDNISPYLPCNAGAALYDLRPEPGSLAPWNGFAMFCLYAVAGLAAAALVLRRRDA